VWQQGRVHADDTRWRHSRHVSDACRQCMSRMVSWVYAAGGWGGEGRAAAGQRQRANPTPMRGALADPAAARQERGEGDSESHACLSWPSDSMCVGLEDWLVGRLASLRVAAPRPTLGPRLARGRKYAIYRALMPAVAVEAARDAACEVRCRAGRRCADAPPRRHPTRGEWISHSCHTRGDGGGDGGGACSRNAVLRCIGPTRRMLLR
jgi:hypothetical protein